MTPKAKAFSLYFKFIRDVIADHQKAKQCALIVVDEILNEYWSHDTNRRDWWEEVKQEIEKL